MADSTRLYRISSGVYKIRKSLELASWESVVLFLPQLQTRRLEVLKPSSLACGVFRGLYDILVQPSGNGDHSASADSSMIFIRNRTIAIHTEDTLAEFQTKQVLKSAIHKASYNRLVVSTPYICSSKDLPYQSFFNSLKQLLVHDKRPAALYSNPLELRLLTVELIADSKRSVVQQDWANYAHPFCLGLRMMKWMGHDAFMMSMCESSVLTMGELSDTIQNYWFSTVHEIVKMWFRRVLLTSSGLLIGGQLWNIRSFVEKLWNGQDIWENIEDAQIFNESPCSMRLRDWVEREGAGNWAVKSVNERWVGGHAALGYRGIELVAQLDPIRQSEY